MPDAADVRLDQKKVIGSLKAKASYEIVSVGVQDSVGG